ncbi:MAG: hypothetical protein ACREJC_19930 [Tepidisphaeraceae bacterium]
MQSTSRYSIHTGARTPKAPASIPKRRHKAIWLAVAALLVALGAGGTYAFWPKNHDKLLAQIGDDREKLRKAVDDGQLTRDEVRDAMWQRREAETDKQVDGYFALPTQKERDKYLDKMIDGMEARRKEFERRAATQPARNRDRERGPTTGPTTQPRQDWQQRMAQRQDNTPPDKRAQRIEFRRAMQQRMTQRGIAPPQGGRGGFGGGGPRPGGGGGGRRQP